jgi:superfamily II DNA or RNA helicase
MTALSQYLPGTEVRARDLRWEVVASESLGPQTLYRLRGLENAILGRELDLLHPFEQIEPVQHEVRPDRAAPLVNWWVYHQAFLAEQALGPTALLAVQPGRLRLEPYQLVPVLRSIRMSRVRLLLADGVGLGKTIQAGLIVTELVARRLAHRVLIVSPAGPLMDQWQLEMSERFGLRLTVIDRPRLEEIRRSTELGSNPFDHVPLGLASIDFLKQERILELLERASYDIVIVDESHHCMDIGGSQEREDSLRRRLAEVLARRCDSLLLLTATPHDGNDRSFASLCELLDPSLVDGRGVLRGDRFRSHVIRRLKSHILVTDPKDPSRRISLFKDRIVTPIAVTSDSPQHEPFVQLQRSLLALIGPELRRAFRNRNYSDVLSYIALLKRSVSTVVACRQTLSVVAERLQHFLTDTAEQQELRKQRIRTLRDYERKLERFGSISAEEEVERSLLEAEDLAQQLAALHRESRRGAYQQSKVSDVVARLDELITLADAARKHDPKLDELIATIREIREQEPRSNILVYTEYIDSQKAVLLALADAKVGPVISMNGEHDEATRSKVTEQFCKQDNLVLVSTDSAAEGLNLHYRCHNLIHLELPFNPNRLEQRNGRIDRYGQQFDPHVRYFYLRGTFEERILLRLIAKYERQRARLTFVPNTLGITASTDAAQARLLKGFMEEDERLFKDDPVTFDLQGDDENEGTDEATRELLEEIDRSLHGFRTAAKTNTWLGADGLNAEEKLVDEAGQAQSEGERVEQVDLAAFVCDAIKLDGGEVIGDLSSDHFAVHIPPAWMHGLDELPGYNKEERLVRLTTKIDVMSDGNEHRVGFLGRAHPLVRRALDRVRNLSFGGTADRGQDARVSAVKGAVVEPTLLFTFLGRVTSRSGRELERVLAVEVTGKSNPKFYGAAAEWTQLADPAKAIRTTDIWKKHFEKSSGAAKEKALAAASAGFAPLASVFTENRRRSLEAERKNLDDWVKRRAEEVTGSGGVAREVQLGFLSDSDEATTAAPAWNRVADPVQRLAGFHLDRNQTSSARFEAEGVLRIYEQRQRTLDSLLDLQTLEPVLLGLLMIVPEVPHGT